jgi:hypothetical protein
MAQALSRKAASATESSTAGLGFAGGTLARDLKIIK